MANDFGERRPFKNPMAVVNAVLSLAVVAGYVATQWP